jgi:hypothetical protein
MDEKIVKDLYYHLGGILLTQKILVHAMLHHGLVEKEALIEMINLALEGLSQEEQKSSFGKPLLSIRRMLRFERPAAQHPQEAYPDWMELISKLPPQGTD